MGLLKFFKLEMTRPNSYGWFHLMFIALVIVATTLLIIFFKNSKDKTFRRIALIGWIIMLVFEIYKQIEYSASITETGVEWDYQWYAFPYQLCSTPLYILPVVAFMKEGKVRDFFTAYISTFALFGGIVVFIYPNDVFVRTAGINIQTMIHHGLQVVLGIYFAVYNRKKLNIKYFLKSIPVFVGLLLIACILNEVIYYSVVSKIGETFNMFYISRHFDCTLVILNQIYLVVPWFVFLLIYVIGFAIASIAVFYIIVGILKLVEKIKSKNVKQ